HLDREYDLNEIAIMTRAAPARLLGLGDRGHLSVGAIADIAVYQPQADKGAMFDKAELVFKNGIAVVEKGQVTRSIQGKTHAVAPGFDRGIEASISDYFDRYHLMKMDHYKLDPQHLLETLGSELVLH
ncbi:amidohydrolase family protein, partial [Sedimenticola sp.]|uniref:amidohydrolase family protein n=1 Tax=Sedimenticola sp. TaxID=1940285 RepID=UPI00258BDA00